MILRGCWCDIVLNVHAPTENKCDGTKAMKVLLVNFDEKVERKGIFKPTIGNEILYETNNDNGERVVN
jgi:hypothetical protein